MAEQGVGRRKKHTKSRKGCFQCKQRHMKCNEVRPRCANCVRLDIICNFPEAPPDSYSTLSLSSPGNHGPIPTVQRGYDDTPDAVIHSCEFPIADLRLLHHWIFTCAKSLHPFAIPVNFWANDLVELGLEFPFLLRGVLALSAVHKASCLQSADRQTLLAKADSHISQSLDTYRKHLERPCLETAVPMFFLSSILFTYNLASSQLEKPEDPIRALHHGLMLLQGINVVTVPHWDRIKDDPIIIRTTRTTSPENLEILDALAEKDNPHEILPLKTLSAILLDNTDKEACTAAIDRLHQIWVRLRHLSSDQDEYSLLFLWPTQVNHHFLNLLAARDPVACIITSHFTALLAQCRPVWWVLKWPQWFLAALEQMLAPEPDLLKWLAWPQQMIHAQTSRASDALAT